MALVNVGETLKNWHSETLDIIGYATAYIPVVLVILTAYGFFIDFLDDIDFIFNQLASRIFSRVRSLPVRRWDSH